MKLDNRIFLMLGIASVFSLNNFAAMCVTYNDCTQPSNEGTYCQRRGFNHKKCPVGCYCQGHSKSAIGDDLHNALANICLNKNPTWPQQQKMASANISLCPADRPYSDNGISNSSECSLNSIISYDASTYSYVPSSSGLGQYCSYKKNSCTVSCPAGCYCTGSKYSAVQTSDFLNNICNGTTSPNSDTTTILNNAGIHTCPAGYRKGGTGAKAITECKNASGVSYTPSNNKPNLGHTYNGDGLTVVSGDNHGDGNGDTNPRDPAGYKTCNNGYYWDGFDCKLCVAGNYCLGASYSTSVTTPRGMNPCPSGEYSGVGASECKKCVEDYGLGYTSTSDHTGCEEIPDGMYVMAYSCANPNASSILMGNAPSDRNVRYGENYNIPSNSCSYKGWNFDGWECDHNLRNGTNVPTVYQPGDSVLFNVRTHIKCTAKWTAKQFTVTYRAGLHGSGTDVEQTVTFDSPWSTRAFNFTINGDYTFDKWNTNQNGTGTNYAADASQENWVSSNNLTLYATYNPVSGDDPANGSGDDPVDPTGTTRTITVPAGYYLPSSSVDPSHTPTECEWLDINDDLYDDVRDDEFCPGGSFKVSTTHDAKGIYHCVRGGTHSDDYKTCKVQLSKDKLEHGILGEWECWLAETADEYKDCVFSGARDVKPNN